MGIREWSKNKGKCIRDASGPVKGISEEKETDNSEREIGREVGDEGGKPKLVTEEEKQKGKPEMGIIVHDENACSSSSSSSTCVVDDSDAKWERFLPENYKDIISKSASALSLNSLSKKDIYFHLCDHPIIIDNGKKSFAIDKNSGKICYMIGARGLVIEWGEEPEYWQWKSLPESRFSEVAELKAVWWLHIKGKIETKMLSPGTTYGVYLVFKLAQSISGFQQTPVELRVDFEGQESGSWQSVYLDTLQPCQDDRGDGWREIEMGEFVIKDGKNGRVVCKLKEDDVEIRKEGLIIEGIEFRPKDG